MNKNAYHFPGLSVFVPDQTNQEVDIVPVNLPDKIPDDIPRRTENFTVIRYIANIVLFRKDHLDKENYEEPIQKFDPPIEFRVNYNMEDVNQVKRDINGLKLAYWDMEKWVIISDQSHEYQILPSSTAQIAETKIHSWLGDPPLAWGR